MNTPPVRHTRMPGPAPRSDAQAAVPTPPSPRHTQVFIPARTRNATHAAPAVAQNIPSVSQNIPATPLLQASDFFSTDAKESLVGKCLDNRYDIISHLASGGMSEIYLASQRGIGQQVIIKKLHPHLYQDKNAVQRFIEEARTYAALTHPNAVKMYDLLNVNGQICIVMEYVAGKTLSSYLEEGHVFTIRQILDIAMQISDALGTVHKVGIIHRDLKSENIMLMETVGERYSVKILDFGIAKITTNAQSNLTQEGAIVGTPKYMSPEQGCGRKDIDARTDIYSFGIIMYEAICGHLPFDGESSLAILHQQIYADVPAMSRPDNSEVPLELQNLIFKCLKKEPNERYSSFSEIVHELTEIQENRSIAALTAIPKDTDNVSNTCENDVLEIDLSQERPDLSLEDIKTQAVDPSAVIQELEKQKEQTPEVSKPVARKVKDPVMMPKTLETVQAMPPVSSPKKKSGFWLKACIVLLLLIIGGMVFIVMNDPKLKAGVLHYLPKEIATTLQDPEPVKQDVAASAAQNAEPQAQPEEPEVDDDTFNFDLKDESSAEKPADEVKADDKKDGQKAVAQGQDKPEPAKQAAESVKPQKTAQAAPAAPQIKETKPVESKPKAPSAPSNTANSANTANTAQAAANVQPVQVIEIPKPAETPQPVQIIEVPTPPSVNPSAQVIEVQPPPANAQPVQIVEVQHPAVNAPAAGETAAAQPVIQVTETPAQAAKPANNNDDGDIDLEEDDKSKPAVVEKKPAQPTIGDIEVGFSFLSDFSNQALRPHIHQVLAQAQDCKWLGNTGLQFVFTNKGGGSFARFQRRFSGSADPCLIKAFESYLRFPALETETTTVKIVIQKK